MTTLESHPMSPIEGNRMQAVKRALDLALVVIESGGSTVITDRTFRQVLKGHGEHAVTAVWRLDFVAASILEEGHWATVVRPIGPIGVNLTRASEAVVLGQRFARGEVDPSTLPDEIDRVTALAPLYGRWVMLAAAACTAAFFSRIPGGDWGASAIAFVAAAVGQFFRSTLQARKVAIPTVTLICGVISACIAAVGLRLHFSQTAPATAIASVIYLVPGLPLINGFIDVISHQHLFIGVQRIAKAAFLFLVLAIAIALVRALVM